MFHIYEVSIVLLYFQQHENRTQQEVVVTEKTFAAITPSGGVIAWGEPEAPGGCNGEILSNLVTKHDETVFF